MSNTDKRELPLVGTVLTTKASEELEAAVEEELNIPDPTPEQARAILEAPEKG